MSKKIWVSDLGWQQLCRSADSGYPLETGGMLFGYQADNADYVICSIVGPGPRAIHRRYSFIPDADYQQSELEKLHRLSRGRGTYLGDWHTHTAGGAELSVKDKKTLARIAKESTGCSVSPVMLVLASCSGEWQGVARRFLSYRRRWWITECDVEALSITVFSSEGPE